MARAAPIDALVARSQRCADVARVRPGERGPEAIERVGVGVRLEALVAQLGGKRCGLAVDVPALAAAVLDVRSRLESKLEAVSLDHGLEPLALRCPGAPALDRPSVACGEPCDEVDPVERAQTLAGRVVGSRAPPPLRQHVNVRRAARRAD